MYFDFDYYYKVLKHVWGLKSWPHRRKTLFKLLVIVPLESSFHAVFFLLDYVLFPKLWLQKISHNRSSLLVMQEAHNTHASINVS